MTGKKTTCGKCNKALGKGGSVVCDICQLWFHYDCAEVSEEFCANMSRNEKAGAFYKCLPCRTNQSNNSDSDDQIALIHSKLDAISNQLRIQKSETQKLIEASVSNLRAEFISKFEKLEADLIGCCRQVKGLDTAVENKIKKQEAVTNVIYHRANRTDVVINGLPSATPNLEGIVVNLCTFYGLTVDDKDIQHVCYMNKSKSVLVKFKRVRIRDNLMAEYHKTRTLKLSDFIFIMSFELNLGPVVHDDIYLRNSFSNSLLDLKLGHFNCQSFSLSSRSSKLNEIHSILDGCVLDIVGVSETWLKPYISSNAVSIPGYSFYRSDRPCREENGNGGRGGGVGLYLSNKLQGSVVFKSSDFGSFECIFIEICHSNYKLLVGVVYLPYGDIELMEDRLSDLLVRYDNIIIMGDFNLNLFDINNTNIVLSTCRRLGLSYHHNNMPTHYVGLNPETSLLDYFLLSPSLSVTFSGQMQCPAISHHSFIFLSINIQLRPNNVTLEFKDYSNFDSFVLERHVLNYDFSGIYDSTDVNRQHSCLMTCINQLHNLIPTKRFKISTNEEDWFNTPLIKYHLSLRDLTFRQYIREPSIANWRSYCKARNKSKSVIRRVKRRAHIARFNNLDTKGMWRILRSNGCIRDNLPSENLDPDTLNVQFSSYRSIDSFNPFDDLNFPSYNYFAFHSIDYEDLCIALSKIKSNASGCDNLPLKFIKLIFPFIHQQLLFFINSIITNSHFPSDWKISKVIPIRKSSSNEEFRPISLVPVLSKIVEHIIKDQIMVFLNDNLLLHSFQSGFRNGYSTTSLLIGLTDSIRRLVDKGDFAVLVSLDLSKAFDSISHAVLIRKLCTFFNFSLPACKLIFSYLSGRAQYVCCGNRDSRRLPVTSGVPQGSVIGPLLFMLYMNDFFNILDGFECEAFVFADDIQLLFSGHFQLIDVFEYDLNTLLSHTSQWMRDT